ncbi:GNAT family N-acetyltransferase [uncultured Aliiroseovarius sp.]|uniref:GNAT family N-acetyltransferase n=1 Tax=uncultured Aliiroseovarius sp. TaxID=1658783 RepID=UPI0025914859|nr:GNAT family N-acetyltransferase [uncultured Aliiroseovarius sp.]
MGENHVDHNQRRLRNDELGAATALLTQAMLDNPLHVRVFGSDAKSRQRYLSRFFGVLVAYVHANGKLLGTYAQGDLVGVLGMIRPNRCRPGWREKARFARGLLPYVPLPTLWRAYRWLTAWAHHDPVDPHWHIGPLAVHPTHQRQGIGRGLMKRCCAHLDADDKTAWLETDRDINVVFYRALGFTIARHEPVLGVPTWFMQRSPNQ